MTYRALAIYQSTLFVIVGLCFVAVVDHDYDYDGGVGGSGNVVLQPLMRSRLSNRCLRIYGMLTRHSSMPSCW